MSPVDWDSPTWGQTGSNVHIAAWCADGHDRSEQDAEDER